AQSYNSRGKFILSRRDKGNWLGIQDNSFPAHSHGEQVVVATRRIGFTPEQRVIATTGGNRGSLLGTRPMRKGNTHRIKHLAICADTRAVKVEVIGRFIPKRPQNDEIAAVARDARRVSCLWAETRSWAETNAEAD